MNKREQDYLESIEIKASLRLTEEILPDLPIPKSSDGLVKGYRFNVYTSRVSETCSDSVYHNSHDNIKANSQNPMEQYSTKLLALKALRYQTELEVAKKLRAIDIKIKAELDKESQS